MRDVKPRTQPPTQSPAARRHNFEEVYQGYTLKDALAEAARCILCKNARCEAACPFHNKMAQWIKELQQGHIEEAYRIIRETSPMPELCSRLCPYEALCEGPCAIGIKHESVAIGLLERFVCDQMPKVVKQSGPEGRTKANREKKRVAAVGSGPASLAAAQCLVREGHEVTVFERWPRLGGVVRWIPRYKLPSKVLDDHIETLRSLGVNFKTNTEIHSANELLGQGFDAVFLGIGASKPSAPSIPGASLSGILSSTEFLVRVFYDHSALPNSWQPITSLSGKRVVVLGGGDSAMDCVRTSIRLGGSKVTCVYRRDEANMPVSREEVKAAKEEGVNFMFLSSPTAFRSEGKDAVSHVDCVRMKLGEPDASGRRRPIPIENSAFTVEADLVALAFGYEVEPMLEEHTHLIPSPSGTMKANLFTGATALPGVFAGGDCVTGASLVSTAAQSGIVAAKGILRYFAGESWEVLVKLVETGGTPSKSA